LRPNPRRRPPGGRRRDPLPRPIRLESRTEQEARSLITVLKSQRTVGPYLLNGVWVVDVSTNGDSDRILEQVINAALACYADGKVGGFTLDADGHRIPVGFAPNSH
jgi:hypothetical protein